MIPCVITTFYFDYVYIKRIAFGVFYSPVYWNWFFLNGYIARKINAQYNMTSEDVHGQAKFDDSVGIFPEFIDGYNILILPTTGRYFEVIFLSCFALNLINPWMLGINENKLNSNDF